MHLPDGLVILEETDGFERVLTPGALEFVRDLVRKFRDQVNTALKDRQTAQEGFDRGYLPRPPAHTAAVREGDWRVAEPPSDLLRRHVEITGPVTAKMAIYALNSGAECYMADLEDSTSPTWENLMQAQVVLKDAVRRELSVTVRLPPGNTTATKTHTLNERTATLLVRPRGLHLQELHIEVDGEPVPACLVDFGIFFYHNARELVIAGSGPYFYLPKLETHLEARIWAEVFRWSEDRLRLQRGTVRCTVLAETVPLIFEVDEVLYELREYGCAMNCGRWDYLFSWIKKFREHKADVLPDRDLLTMDTEFMGAYVRHVVDRCHRRGAYCIGGMSAFIPTKDPKENFDALVNVANDKRLEFERGHDGTWVAHPGLIETARHEMKFDVNQLDVTYDLDLESSLQRILTSPIGPVTDAGIRKNVRVFLQYIGRWFDGTGAVAIDGKMEDAATAEISRAQLWQWVRHGKISKEDMEMVVFEEARKLGNVMADEIDLLLRLVTLNDFEEFFTVPAYRMLVGEV